MKKWPVIKRTYIYSSPKKILSSPERILFPQFFIPGKDFLSPPGKDLLSPIYFLQKRFTIPRKD
jgi:hypothetical protein